jgi:TonB-dependent SusC/RagA subfamily outer membrane receptor
MPAMGWCFAGILFSMRVRGSYLTFGDQNPLIFIDGVKQKELGNEGFKGVKSENIESITVLKDRSATSVYGDDGKDGVIMIKTKK